MKHIQYSDLPLKIGNDSILLFQPVNTADGGTNYHNDREFLERAFNEAASLTGLIHVCSFSCSSQNDELGGLFSLGPQCGGRLILQPTQSVESLRSRCAANQVALTCSNPACHMEVTSTECPTEQDLLNLVLHLMLKQMVPNLPVANYLDCSIKEGNHLMKEGEGDAIRALGLIAIASEFLWGTVSNGYFGTFPERFGFGFMLAPGMQTAEGCGGYDQWLKLLVEKKFESLKEVYRSLAPLLLGPKLPRRG